MVPTYYSYGFLYCYSIKVVGMCKQGVIVCGEWRIRRSPAYSFNPAYFISSHWSSLGREAVQVCWYASVCLATNALTNEGKIAVPIKHCGVR